MRAYEKDDIRIPGRYRKMSVEQLDKKSRIMLKISKLLPKFRKKKIDYNKNIKFYL